MRNDPGWRDEIYTPGALERLRIRQQQMQQQRSEAAHGSLPKREATEPKVSAPVAEYLKGWFTR